MKNSVIWFIKVVLAFLLVFSFGLSGAVCAESGTDESGAISLNSDSIVNSTDNQSLYPNLLSDNAVVVYNIESNQILYSNRGDEVLSPTVATKLITMMVVYDIFDEYNIYPKTQMITVETQALTGIGNFGDKSAPRLGLTAGNSFTAEDLIGATLVSNASDACNVLAYYCATELLNSAPEAFIARMNEKAAEIGAEDSHFKNATGVQQSEMVTTPKDVALIAAAFYKYNDLLVLADRPSMLFNQKSTVHTKNYLLSDALINNYKNTHAIGIIAGQRSDTDGYALITAVEKDGLSFIIVVMEASGEVRETDGSRYFTTGNAYEDMAVLIPWTRESFGYQTLAEESKIVAELRIDMGKNYDYVSVVPEKKVELLVNNAVDITKIEETIEFTDIVYKSEFNDALVDTVNAPITKGEVVGTLTFSYSGNIIGSVNIVAQRTVDASGLLSTANKVTSFLFGSTMRTVLIIFGIIVIVYVIYSFISAIVRGIKRIKKKKNSEDKIE